MSAIYAINSAAGILTIGQLNSRSFV